MLLEQAQQRQRADAMHEPCEQPRFRIEPSTLPRQQLRANRDFEALRPDRVQARLQHDRRRREQLPQRKARHELARRLDTDPGHGGLQLTDRNAAAVSRTVGHTHNLRGDGRILTDFVGEMAGVEPLAPGQRIQTQRQVR